MATTCFCNIKNNNMNVEIGILVLLIELSDYDYGKWNCEEP
jgi:hypothetical protein